MTREIGRDESEASCELRSRLRTVVVNNDEGERQRCNESERKAESSKSD